ncbi:hypothetical protein AQUCO_02500363v1 [Aquilegia coerulea]|uniref:F-box associated beta-propeller type 3 domain-containing protein n=1 Tax=Aquilegia coerulea TaxID=218851 RepID=A0A2G5DAQ7_AQUCA|nr:hypothetical protein AQUCO_02500363v1 [Aquilegia coerulea]
MDYKIVRLLLISKTYYEVDEDYYLVDILTFGTNEWRSISKELATFSIVPHSSSGIWVNGSLYWLATKNSGKLYLLCVSLANETLRVIPVAIESRNFSRTHMFHLGELGGALICVDNGSLEFATVWTMMEDKDGISITWTKRVYKRPESAFGCLGLFDSSVCVGFRPLVMLHDGAILVHIFEQKLIVYKPDGKQFKLLEVKNLPRCFKVVPHLGTLLRLNDAIKTAGCEDEKEKKV